MCSERVPSATTRVMSIPEIVDLICSLGCLSRSDLANLCQVSRYMLDIGTPLLWRNATAEDLLGLIDSADLYWRSNDTLSSIRLDAFTADNETFKRFHSYAPYVQNLEIYDGKYRRCYTVDGWNVLRDEIEVQGRPLLPNLKSLRFLNISSSHGFNELIWISIFATHGVKEVSLVPSRPSPSGQIPFSLGSTILETLVDLCPNIQTLDLSTKDRSSSTFVANARFRTALAHQPTRPWYQEVECLTQLRHLTVSEGWLYPASFEVLGGIPQLESLTIVPGELDDFDYRFDPGPVLPKGTFPQLTKLSLLGFDGYDIGIILSIAEITRKVTTVKLELSFDDIVDDTYWELENIFEGLRDALSLRELYVTFPFRPDEGERSVNAYDSIEKMGPHLSLEYVHISGIRITRDSCYIRKLATIWPNVRTLSMPSQSTSIRELEEFATLPSLRHLTVNLDLKNPELLTEVDVECTPLETLTSSGPVRLSTVYKHLSLIACALISLWPSLERVTWSDEDPGRTQLAHFFNSEVLPFSRELLFETSEEDVQFSSIKSKKEMRAFFKLVVEDVEEADSDLDMDTDPNEESDSE